MLDPKDSRFWKATLLSGLMDEQGLTACWNAILPGKRNDPQHIDRRIARQAVQALRLPCGRPSSSWPGVQAGSKSIGTCSWI